MLPLLYILIWLPLVCPKIFDSYMIAPQLSQQENWFYLGRQVLSPGTSSISLQTQIKGTPFSKFESIEFAVFNQSQWDLNEFQKCECKPEYSLNHPLKMNGESTHSNLTIKTTQPSLYYFVFRDCSQLIIGEKQNYFLHIAYKLTVLNNQSHLGHYQSGFFLVMMLVSTLMLCYKVLKDGQKTEERDWIQIGLIVGLLSQAAGLISKLMSFVISWRYGQRFNSILFNIVYSVLGSFGDSLIASVLLFISFGWTIIFISLQQYQIYIPPISIFSFGHILLSILGVANETLHNKYHIHDSIPGILLIFIKVIGIIIFVYGITRSYGKGSPVQQKFIAGFGIVGVLYFLIMPLTYLICQFGITQSKQEHYSFVIKETLSITFNILFAYNLVDSNSIYRTNRKRHTFLPVDEKFY